MKDSKRKEFLARMFKEAMIPYEHLGEEWSEDEKEFLPLFQSLVGRRKLILDLAGGYGRVTPHLMQNNNSVILADLSLHSLQHAKKTLENTHVDFIRIDMRYLPFADSRFHCVWFAQAFEYVPPDTREEFLYALRKVLRSSGFVFINIAKVPNECSRVSYLKNYLYWKLVKMAPVVWGDYIYRLHSKDYQGWHYHSVVFTRRIEKSFGKANFKILNFKDYGKKGYFSYILQATSS